MSNQGEVTVFVHGPRVVRGHGTTTSLFCPNTGRLRDGTQSRATFRKYISEIRPCFREELERGAISVCAKTAAVCRDLLRLGAALWTFVRVEGIEPTNNAVERALWHAILWRNNSHGTDSEAGSRFVEKVLSIVATCRRQGRDVLDYLSLPCEAVL